MKATKILQFLSEGNIDALRTAAEIEVMSEKIGSPNAVKARVDCFLRKAERDIAEERKDD